MFGARSHDGHFSSDCWIAFIVKLFTSSFNNIIDFPSIYGCCLEEGRVGCWLLVPSCFLRLYNRMFKSACKA